ncbi:MAG TPA: hypothetical protein VL550_06715 [Rhodocyclaceae bacterium]|nr:hypothetical protein [Rhodocyclaceae bacterium]
MIIYTRFIRPTMPPDKVVDVFDYIAPSVAQTRRKARRPPKVTPKIPKTMGACSPAWS